ncbi:unnamed protein product [Sphenostylis stenocarpa]|uniref:CSC1/OSCA1-like cytosolic domain-containing protein n=1 Tax=Sphenostylis stenocarpa TaxID=92480 RepID=A0AA86RR73_9FABA|nr:unnamed protein product [Sphenostylis stenocarpa]
MKDDDDVAAMHVSFVMADVDCFRGGQSCNLIVYAPRLVSERKRQEGGQSNLERLLATDWLRQAWETSEEEFLSTAGLDAFVFMRIFTRHVYLVQSANLYGRLSNRLKSGSECKYISSKRIACFYSSKPEPHHFSILVRGIPVPVGSTCTDAVKNFFQEYHPSTYHSHAVVRRSSKVQILITDAERLYKRLTQLKSKDDAPQRHRRDGCLGLFGHKVDMLDHYEKTLGNIADNVRIEQSSVAGKEVPAAFVSFKSRFGAAIALNIQEGVNPTHWITEQAPEPQDVYWPFFSVTFIRRWISKLVAYVACNVLTILFLIPVALVQGLTHLDQLETMFPSLRCILRM